MATAYSGEVAVGSYNRIRLRVEYSGTSATCYIEFRRTSAWSDTWGDDAAEISFNGQTKAAPYWYTGYVDGTWRDIDSASGYTIPITGGTFNWKFNNPLEASVLGCSGTIVIPSQQVAPNTPTVSVASNNTSNSLDITWGTSSFGNPNTGTAYIYSGTSASPTQMQYSKTTTGNSLWTNTGLAANTKYYYRARAKNTADLWSSYSADATGVVRAAPATVSLSSYDSASATISYSASADGGYYDRYIQYSLDGTNWSNAVTITGGSADSGTFTVSGLNPDTAYTIRTRMTTTAGSLNGSSISVTTKPAVAIYGSVNGQTKKIAKLYGSVNGETKLIKKLYASVNGVTKKVYEG